MNAKGKAKCRMCRSEPASFYSLYEAKQVCFCSTSCHEKYNAQKAKTPNLLLIQLEKETTDDDLLRYDKEDDIFQACHRGEHNSDRLQSLLEEGASANQTNEQGQTLLAYSISKGDIRTLQVLLNAGADVDGLDSSSKTPLMVAAAIGAEKKMDMLLKRAANALLQDAEGKTALHMTESNANPDCASMLLKHEPGLINMKNNFDQTVAHLVAGAGNLTILTTLLDHGATVDGLDNLGRAPLHYAVLEKAESCVSPLLNAENGTKVLDLPDRFGSSPIHYAVQLNNPGILKMFIDKGCDVNTTNPAGRSPLSLAAAEGGLDACRLLVEKCNDVNATDKQGYSALHYAARAGESQICELLIQHGADVNLRNNQEQTPMFSAVCNAHTEVVHTLVEKGAKCDAITDARGRNPSHYAAENGHKAMLRLLLQYSEICDGKGCDTCNPDDNPIHAKDDDGHTTLYLAVINKHIDCLKMLIKRGVYVDEESYKLLADMKLVGIVDKNRCLGNEDGNQGDDEDEEDYEYEYDATYDQWEEEKDQGNTEIIAFEEEDDSMEVTNVAADDDDDSAVNDNDDERNNFLTDEDDEETSLSSSIVDDDEDRSKSPNEGTGTSESEVEEGRESDDESIFVSESEVEDGHESDNESIQESAEYDKENDDTMDQLHEDIDEEAFEVDSGRNESTSKSSKKFEEISIQAGSLTPDTDEEESVDYLSEESLSEDIVISDSDTEETPESEDDDNKNNQDDNNEQMPEEVRRNVSEIDGGHKTSTSKSIGVQIKQYETIGIQVGPLIANSLDDKETYNNVEPKDTGEPQVKAMAEKKDDGTDREEDDQDNHENAGNGTDKNQDIRRNTSTQTESKVEGPEIGQRNIRDKEKTEKVNYLNAQREPTYDETKVVNILKRIHVGVQVEPDKDIQRNDIKAKASDAFHLQAHKTSKTCSTGVQVSIEPIGNKARDGKQNDKARLETRKHSDIAIQAGQSMQRRKIGHAVEMEEKEVVKTQRTRDVRVQVGVEKLFTPVNDDDAHDGVKRECNTSLITNQSSDVAVQVSPLTSANKADQRYEIEQTAAAKTPQSCHAHVQVGEPNWMPDVDDVVDKQDYGAKVNTSQGSDVAVQVSPLTSAIKAVHRNEIRMIKAAKTPQTCHMGVQVGEANLMPDINEAHVVNKKEHRARLESSKGSGVAVQVLPLKSAINAVHRNEIEMTKAAKTPQTCHMAVQVGEAILIPDTDEAHVVDKQEFQARLENTQGSAVAVQVSTLTPYTNDVHTENIKEEEVLKTPQTCSVYVQVGEAKLASDRNEAKQVYHEAKLETRKGSNVAVQVTSLTPDSSTNNTYNMEETKAAKTPQTRDMRVQIESGDLASGMSDKNDDNFIDEKKVVRAKLKNRRRSDIGTQVDVLDSKASTTMDRNLQQIINKHPPKTKVARSVQTVLQMKKENQLAIHEEVEHFKKTQIFLDPAVWKKKFADEKRRTLLLRDKLNKLKIELDQNQRRVVSHLERRQASGDVPRRLRDPQMVLSQQTHDNELLRMHVDLLRTQVNSETMLRNLRQTENNEIRTLRNDYRNAYQTFAPQQQAANRLLDAPDWLRPARPFIKSKWTKTSRKVSSQLLAFQSSETYAEKHRRRRSSVNEKDAAKVLDEGENRSIIKSAEF